MKKLFFLIILISLLSTTSRDAFAAAISSVPSAQLQPNSIKQEEDSRVKILKEFLKKYNSPLAENANDFVSFADKYSLDWKLVTAISGLESTFGQQIPYNSYNGWGWGIYGNNVIYFSSWKEGIETVSRGLRENYLDKWGTTNIYEIGEMYAASPTWASRVTYLMDTIAEFALANPKNTLSLSL